MYLKKKMRQGISAALIAVMSFGNVISAMADMPRTNQTLVQTSTVTNKNYRATVDFTGENIPGGVLRSKNSDTDADWNVMTETMVPGSTMFIRDDGTARSANVSAKNLMTTGDGTIGASGVELEGELSGVKSYFMFGDEILFLGAGLQNEGSSSDQVITVIDNVPVNNSIKVGIPNPTNGYYIVRNQAKVGGKWEAVVDTATKGKQTRNWMMASDLSGTALQWKYLFPDSITNSNVYFRFPTNGTGIVQFFELWMQGEQYQYTLKAGGLQSDLSGTVQTENKVIVNTKEIQAAENLTEGILEVNKWTDSSYELKSNVANLNLKQPASIVLRKDESAETAQVVIGKPDSGAEPSIEFTVKLTANQVTESSGEGALADFSEQSDGCYVKLDTAKMTKPVVLDISYKLPDVVERDEITLVRGEEKQIALPDEFDAASVTWSAKFLKADGTYLRNAGSSKKKYELPEGESDGARVAGDTSAEHLVTVKKLSNGNAIVTAKEKGKMVLVAEDQSNHKKQYSIEILYTNPETLPEASSEDYAKVRQVWKESLVGSGLNKEEGGTEILASMDQAAKTAWDAYAYKGQDSCPDIPWKADEGAAGVASTPYVDDAAEFRPAFKKVLAMATAYAAEGSQYYQNPDLLNDITNILDYLCSVCYTPKTQTNNWWTWEIGLPKDLIPILMLTYDGLNKEQMKKYTEAMYFFQPDPYHEGVIGTASTHAQAYRTAQGANIIDCSTTAVGLGALMEDNEQLYMGTLASSETFVIQSVEDSTKLAADGYASGFYADGSYMDHSRVPYLGSYGIEFMKGGVKIPSLIGGTPWQYPDEVQQNLEYYIVNGFGSSMYRGLMLDSLKGRSVARKGGSNQAAGREAMSIILQMVDSLSPSARETTLSTLKYWMEYDPGFVESLEGVENLAVRKKAKEILEDSAIEAVVEPIHKSFPFMDRAVHRTDDYLFAVSMYSERTQNTEIMNDENRFGWHQNNGMTYIYDSDQKQYTDNFWNTVNPFRLPGTTVVPVNIGTGKPDSSGYAQGGDFCSYESWVGGSTIGNYGISGMSFSGQIANKAKSAEDEISYAPNLKGKKSWFMFENEIVCLGAGISNSGMSLPVETTIENRRLGEDGENTFIVNGKETSLPLKEADIKELVDRSADLSGTAFDGAEWAYLEGNGESSGTGYYFPEEDTQILARRARTTGNWSDIGTTEGESTQNYLEMWFDHGKNPTDASYSYVLLPETAKEEVRQYADAPQVTVLANTESVQAVYQKELGITGINFWEKNGTVVGDVACDGEASVMLQETEDGRLKVAVSDPTMKNKGTIKLTLNKPILEEISMDSNVTCESHEDGSVTLQFSMEGTNGASSNAELQLDSSIYPSAVTLKKGTSQAFEVRSYGSEMAEMTEWSIQTAKERMAAGTVIDKDGVLTIDENEAGSALLVTAKLESGLELHAYVSLGKDAVLDIPGQLPEEMKQIQDLIEKAFEDIDGDEEYDENAIKRAVKAVQEADSEALAQYLMDSVLKLAQLYKNVWEKNGRELSEHTETIGTARQLEPVDAGGMVLSIYPSTKMTSSSKAVLVIRGEEELETMDIASASNARMIIATDSNAAAMKATPSNAVSFHAVPEQINEKPIESESFCSFLFSLFKESDDDEENRSALPMKALVKAEISIPDSLDTEKTVVAAVVDEKGKQYPVNLTVNEDGTRLTLILTRMGTLILANSDETVSEPERPDNPDVPDDPKDPDEPQKPEHPSKPEKPSNSQNPTESEEPDAMVYEVFIDDEITGGTVTADRLTGTEGTKITLTAKPNLGYKLEYLQVNGKTVKTNGKGNYSFKLKQDTEVTASFIKLLAAAKRSERDKDDSEGWVWSVNGWKYRNTNGSYAKNGWQMIDGQWYRFDAKGGLCTGWYLEPQDGYWYYMKEDGSMATGWQCINDNWYYFNPVTIGVTGWSNLGLFWQFTLSDTHGIPQGAMYCSQITPDGCQVDEHGVWIP